MLIGSGTMDVGELLSYQVGEVGRLRPAGVAGPEPRRLASSGSLARTSHATLGFSPVIALTPRSPRGPFRFLPFPGLSPLIFLSHPVAWLPSTHLWSRFCLFIGLEAVVLFFFPSGLSLSFSTSCWCSFEYSLYHVAKPQFIYLFKSIKWVCVKGYLKAQKPVPMFPQWLRCLENGAWMGR